MSRRAFPTHDVIDAAAELFAAAAHPARLSVLIALSRSGPLSAGELQQHADMEQTAMSHQLRTLRQAKLVSAERSGRQMIYALVDHHIAHIVEDALVHVMEDHDA